MKLTNENEQEKRKNVRQEGKESRKLWHRERGETLFIYFVHFMVFLASRAMRLGRYSRRLCSRPY